MNIVKAYIQKKEELQKRAADVNKKEKEIKEKINFNKPIEENKQILNEKDSVFCKKSE